MQAWQSAVQMTSAAQAEYQQLSAAWFSQQAGHLAKAYVSPGMPCPFCGSTTHPQLAQLPDSAVDKANVDEAVLARDKTQQAESNSHRAYEVVSAEVQQLEVQLQEKAAFLDVLTLDEIPDAAYARKKSASAQLETIKSCLMPGKAQPDMLPSVHPCHFMKINSQQHRHSCAQRILPCLP